MQWGRALTALPEDQSAILSAHVRRLTDACNYSSTEPVPSSGL